MPDKTLHYIHEPVPTTGGTGSQPVIPLPAEVNFLSIDDFIADEPACRNLWDLIQTQFRTRSKFFAIWPAVRFVCLHRDAAGEADGFLLVSSLVNWQIDYVVVRPGSRGQGIAGMIVRAALGQASERHVPYVMLTCKESLRALYEGCGFRVVGD